MTTAITESGTREPKKRLPELRAWMERTGSRQYDLARLLNVSEATVSRYLSGKVELSPEPAIRLALLTDIPVEKLLTDGRAARLLKLLGKQSNVDRSIPKKKTNVA